MDCFPGILDKMRVMPTLIALAIVFILGACCTEKNNNGYTIYLILSGKSSFSFNEEVSVYYNDKKIGKIEQLSLANDHIILSATIDEAVQIPQGSFFEVNDVLSPGLSKLKFVIIPSSVTSEFYSPGDFLIEFKSVENHVFTDSAVVDSLKYYINEIDTIIEEQTRRDQ